MAILDIGFEWPIDDGGYQIEKRKRKEGDTALTTKGGTFIVRCGGTLRRHKPIEFHPSLFMQFAYLDGSAESCREFASRFGYLGLFPWWKDGNAPEDLVGPEGESLVGWQSAIKNMHGAVEVWQRDPRALLVGGREETKIANLDVVLAPSPPDGSPSLRIRPRSLLGAMWVQFAQAVTSDLVIKPCKQCGEWFEAGGERRRRTATFCSDKCRADYHNAKKRKAS